jgi:hypothetical protein
MGLTRRNALALVGALATGSARGAELEPMKHVVLLGDSVFDNAAYVAGGPDVATQLRERLYSPWRATLGAVDGSVMSSLPEQLARLPRDASCLVVSIGGNDAIGMSSVLGASSGSVAESLLRLAEVRDRFQRDYAAMLDAVGAVGVPAAFCTIYEPRYPDATSRRAAAAALALIDDCIIRLVSARGLPVIELRSVCSEDADFANPIEPSVQGGGKIADAIAGLLITHDFGAKRAEIITR